MTTRRNSNLEEVMTRDPGFSCQGIVGEFISCYLMCEVFALRLQHYYQTDKGHKKISLNTKPLREAITHFDSRFPEDTLLEIFKGGSGKQGSKSARQLRNGYLHTLSKADKDEITEKGLRLTKAMKQFLVLRINL